MRDVVVALLLGLGVCASWLAALGLLRLRTALDRLHLVSFLNITAGLAFALAALLQEGFAARAIKLMFLVLVSQVIGAGLSHTTGRALVQRTAAGEQE